MAGQSFVFCGLTLSDAPLRRAMHPWESHRRGHCVTIACLGQCVCPSHCVEYLLGDNTAGFYLDAQSLTADYPEIVRTLRMFLPVQASSWGKGMAYGLS